MKILSIVVALISPACFPAAAQTLSLSTFESDVTPPLGSPLCFGSIEPAAAVETPLSARGVVIFGSGDPIVLCVADFVVIANESHDRWKEELAKAAGTTPARVAMHVIHNHDSPGCDIAALDLPESRGFRDIMTRRDAHDRAIAATAHAVREAVATRISVTHADMKAAWEGQSKVPVTAADLDWRVAPAELPWRGRYTEQQLEDELVNPASSDRDRMRAARDLVFYRRWKEGREIDIQCLRIGDGRLLFFPGELFVEYQLAAKALRPGDFVAVAAYGDGGPGYIGTAIAYEQGGYEVSRVSRTAPSAEEILTGVTRKLLE